MLWIKGVPSIADFPFSIVHFLEDDGSMRKNCLCQLWTLILIVLYMVTVEALHTFIFCNLLPFTNLTLMSIVSFLVAFEADTISFPFLGSSTLPSSVIIKELSLLSLGTLSLYWFLLPKSRKRFFVSNSDFHHYTFDGSLRCGIVPLAISDLNSWINFLFHLITVSIVAYPYLDGSSNLAKYSNTIISLCSNSINFLGKADLNTLDKNLFSNLLQKSIQVNSSYGTTMVTLFHQNKQLLVTVSKPISFSYH